MKGKWEARHRRKWVVSRGGEAQQFGRRKVIATILEFSDYGRNRRRYGASKNER